MSAWQHPHPTRTAKLHCILCLNEARWFLPLRQAVAVDNDVARHRDPSILQDLVHRAAVEEHVLEKDVVDEVGLACGCILLRL